MLTCLRVSSKEKAKTQPLKGQAGETFAFGEPFSEPIGSAGIMP